MMPQVLDFLPGSLDDTNKNIQVADRHYVTTKQKGKARIKIYNDNRDILIARLHNILLAPDLCDRLFPLLH